MNYCFNCGVKLETEMKFCPDCGVRIAEYEAKTDSRKTRGIIFTNKSALAQKYAVSEQYINELLQRYINKLQQASVAYTLVDVSYSLTPEHSWLQHSSILADYYNGISEQQRPNYLFIIGSSDIIPMPVVEHFIADRDFPDGDIETDLPYSYLSGEKTQELLWSAEIFRRTPLFHVGRLPLGTDSTIETLNNYLLRAEKAAESGIEVYCAYGQTDINWREVSVKVSSGLSPLLPAAMHEFDEDVCHQGLFTTPFVDAANVRQVFDTGAHLYYFNMHGSDAPSDSGFVGQHLYDGAYVHGISPEQISRVRKSNIFVTEACYGAKFNGYKTQYSMLLSALSSQTVNYLGSSRIAWGMIDLTLEKYPSANLNNADLICHTFMESLRHGASMGEALYEARKSCFKSTLSPIEASSIVTFNLFGDPTIFSVWKNGEKRALRSKDLKMPPLASETSPVGFSVKTIETGGSLLSVVRGMVDKNIAHIREKLANYIGENLGLDPDSLRCMLKVKYISGNEEYISVFSKQTDNHKKFYLIETDSTGNINTVLTSK